MTFYPRRGDRRSPEIKKTEAIARMARITPLLDQVVREITNLRQNNDQEIIDIIKQDYRLIVLTTTKRLAGKYYFRDKQNGFTAENQVEKLLLETMNDEDYLYRKKWLGRIETKIGLIKFFKGQPSKKVVRRKTGRKEKPAYVPPTLVIEFVTQEVKDFELKRIGKITHLQELAEKFEMKFLAVKKALAVGLEPEVRAKWLDYSVMTNGPTKRQQEILDLVTSGLEIGYFWSLKEVINQKSISYRTFDRAMAWLDEKNLLLWNAFDQILKIEKDRLKKGQKTQTAEEYAKQFDIESVSVEQLFQQMLSSDEIILRTRRLDGLDLPKPKERLPSYCAYPQEVLDEIVSTARTEMLNGSKPTSNNAFILEHHIGHRALQDLLADNFSEEQLNARKRKIRGGRASDITDKVAKQILAHVRRELKKNIRVDGARQLTARYGGSSHYVLYLLKSRLSDEEWKQRLSLAHKRDPKMMPHLRARNLHMSALTAISKLGEVMGQFDNDEYKKTIIDSLYAALSTLE